MLMPAAVLVVVVLGAITVDSAVQFTAQRELVSAAQAAANDAVAYGIDENAFRAGRGYVIDPDRVDAVVQRSLASHGLQLRHQWHAEGDRIVVEVEEEVPPVFGRAIPGWQPHVVHGRADAELIDEP
jgi:type II secretory pathway component PulM